MYTERRDLLESIAETTNDFRAGDILTPTPEHVQTWVAQFAEDAQIDVLKETYHVLKQTYLPKTTVEKFLSNLVVNDKITGGNPRHYWSSVKFLDIQQGGNSQHEMLKIFGIALKRECGLNFDECNGSSGSFVYLDDGIYTGNRLLNDLKTWIKTDAPENAEVNVIVIALHLGGKWYVGERLKDVTNSVGRSIKINWWRCVEIEDRKTYIYSSDVLRPTEIPDERPVLNYVESLKYRPTLRKPGSLGKNELFSSVEGRHTLEQEFLKAGVRIRSICPNLSIYQRPLGNVVLETLGFGSLLVTYRNCPNNAPLALWVGDPWYPLFPRKTN